MADRGVGASPNPIMAIEGLGLHCVTRVSKIVRALLEDETVFSFEILTA